jgi:hypothetical protein
MEISMKIMTIKDKTMSLSEEKGQKLLSPSLEEVIEDLIHYKISL